MYCVSTLHTSHVVRVLQRHDPTDAGSASCRVSVEPKTQVVLFMLCVIEAAHAMLVSKDVTNVRFSCELYAAGAACMFYSELYTRIPYRIADTQM